MALPGWLSLGPHWLLPALELGLLCALVVSSPGRLERRSAALRAGGLALAGLLSLANAISAALLVNELARGSAAESAAALLLAGGSIWAANVLIFALWYWELDRGGPADRCHAVRMYPDFLFPQMQQPDLAPADWKPSFTDYLYLSFTNAISFAASDVTPDPLGEDDDDAAVGRLGCGHRARGRQGGRHLRLTAGRPRRQISKIRISSGRPGLTATKRTRTR
jgi:hypothetical protein